MTHLALLILSQTVPGVPAVGPSWFQALIGEATALLVPMLAVALFALLLVGIHWAVSKAKGTRFENAVRIAGEAVEGAVLRLKTKMLVRLGEATADASEGGKAITATERAALLAEGVAALKAELPGAVVATLKGAFGGGLDSWLGAKVERAIVTNGDVLPPR